jgi:hypothetical protein
METVFSHLGAWYRRPILITFGLVTIMLAWLRGILWPKSTEERQQALQAKSEQKHTGGQA